jgi:hypothetical protein
MARRGGLRNRQSWSIRSWVRDKVAPAASPGSSQTWRCGEVLTAAWFNQTRIAHIKDGDGDGELEPNTPYRLDDDGNFFAVKSAKKEVA